MPFMFFQCARVDNNVVQEGAGEAVKAFSQDVVHQTLEGRGCIGETERHH